MKININDYIKVNLTAYGTDVFMEYYYSVCKNFLSDREIIDYINSRFEDGFLKIQMWEFCKIFGSNMFNGGKQLIYKNEIVINE